MNSLKTTAILLLLVFSQGSLTAQSTQKTLVKSFNLQGANQVILNLDGPVDVQSWNHKTVRVQMNIALLSRAESFLKGMIASGRYNLKSALKDNALVIEQPGMLRDVKLKSGKLQETISFTVFAPENVHVEINNEASSSNSNLETGGSK